jgi:hypothetical protein
MPAANIKRVVVGFTVPTNASNDFVQRRRADTAFALNPAAGIRSADDMFQAISRRSNPVNVHSTVNLAEIEVKLVRCSSGVRLLSNRRVDASPVRPVRLLAPMFAAAAQQSVVNSASHARHRRSPRREAAVLRRS